MKINRKKFIDETGGDLGVAFEIIDALCIVIDYYRAVDECASEHGLGCFCDPLGTIKQILKNNRVDEFITIES